MNAYEKIEQGNALMRLFVLTVIGASLNVIFIVFSFTEFFISHQPLWELPQFVGIILYFFLTIVYSLVTTLSFSPKRIVSPLYVQFLTAGIMTIILSSLLLTNTNSVYANNPAYLIQLALITLALFILMGMLGFVQTEILRRIVGLNGNDNDLDRVTYSIDAKFDHVKKIITERPLLILGDFNVKTQDEMLVLKSGLNIMTEKIILVLSHDPENNEKSILATVAFESRYTYISKSEDATSRLDSILLKLDKNLKNNERVITTFDNDASRLARKIALKITEPKIFAIKNIPRYIFLAILATASLFGIMVYGRYSGHFVSSELFKSSMILIALAVVFEFLPLIKDALLNKNEKN